MRDASPLTRLKQGIGQDLQRVRDRLGPIGTRMQDSWLSLPLSYKLLFIVMGIGFLVILVILARQTFLWDALSIATLSQAPWHIGAIGIGFVLIVLLLLLWRLPKRKAARLNLELKEQFNVENETRKTWATIIGGVAVLFSLLFTWGNLRVTQENLRITQETATKSQELTREGQITDRFTQAINQLGSDKLQIRLGAIYALDRIAKDSPRDRIPITEVLAAYIRTQSAWNERPVFTDVLFETFFLPQEPPKNDPKILGVQIPRNLLSDIQAVVTILGQLSQTYTYDRRGNPSLNLSNTDLRKVNLQNLHFKEANFTGANLGEAELQKAHLEKADFTLARLERSTLTDAHLREANLFGARLWGATLTRADLRGAILRWAGLQGATLEGIQLREADLRWADFRKAHKVAASSIREARNWEYASYSPELLQNLGLPPHHNDQLEEKRELVKKNVDRILSEGLPH